MEQGCLNKVLAITFDWGALATWNKHFWTAFWEPFSGIPLADLSCHLAQSTWHLEIQVPGADTWKSGVKNGWKFVPLMGGEGGPTLNGKCYQKCPYFFGNPSLSWKFLLQKFCCSETKGEASFRVVIIHCERRSHTIPPDINCQLSRCPHLLWKKKQKKWLEMSPHLLSYWGTLSFSSGEAGGPILYLLSVKRYWSRC